MTHQQTPFGRVAVIMGGRSGERQVSLDGGAAVMAALLRQGIDAVAVDGLDALVELLETNRPGRVFNLLHGAEGESGVLQGLLDCHGVPCTGTGLLGSALSMNKAVSKTLCQAHGLDVAPSVLIDASMSAPTRRQAAEAIGYPLVVKPVSQGSSLGVHLVDDDAQLIDAIEQALELDVSVMLERYLDGTELAVTVLNAEVLPPIAIVPRRAFYDYQAKYVDDDTEYRCPCGLDEDQLERLTDAASRAWQALHLAGWARIDFMYCEDRFYLIEANTTPGMTSHSLVPKSADQAGIDFDALVRTILETAQCSIRFGAPS